jgi:SAM-dependent methyltransferase
LTRLLTDPAYAWRVVRFGLGLPVELRTEDRRVLEKVIFKHYRELPDVRRVLFVGVDWYTKHYERRYFRGVEFFTIDVKPGAAKFGGARHVTASLEALSGHFAPGFFDLIICNGVYGHGLNEHAACERAFAECYACLRAGGYFVFGWNDVPEYRGAPLESIENLARFDPEAPPEFGAVRIVTDTAYRHIYDFYRKPSR